MEDKEYENDIMPLIDDELDEATGGSTRSEMFAEVERQAKSEGRKVNLDIGTKETCICNYKYKWAKSSQKESTYNFWGIVVYTVYYDVKCYKCNKTWNRIIRK